MLRVLEIILRSNAVARRLGITRQCLILVINLESIATDAYIRTIAVVILLTLRPILTAIAAIIVATTAAATITTVAAAAIITAAAA